MYTLSQATEYVKNGIANGDDPEALIWFAQASAVATIAQAEAAERQAVALETIASAFTYWLQQEMLPAEIDKIIDRRVETGPHPSDDDDPFGRDDGAFAVIPPPNAPPRPRPKPLASTDLTGE